MCTYDRIFVLLLDCRGWIDDDEELVDAGWKWSGFEAASIYPF